MTRYQGHPNNVGLDALRRELLNQDQKKAQRPEKAPAPALARRPVNHHGRERRAQLRRDLAGAPCACDDRTPCLAHQAISGRRRFLRPR